MSALLCNETHIATCAAVIRDLAPGAAGLEAGVVAETLARENLASVMARYGERGLAMLPGADNGDGEYYAGRCAGAEALPCTSAQAWSYLACLRFQSCDHGGWDKSAARQWIDEASARLVERMRDELLGDRQVWAVEGPSAPTPTPFLCSPLHLAGCARAMVEAEVFAVRHMFDEEIAARLASANLKALGYRADEEEAPLPDGATVGSYLDQCRKAFPVHCGPAERYNHLLCLREQCGSGPDSEIATVAAWTDETLERLQWSMTEALLGDSRVWMAPPAQDEAGPDAAPGP